MFGVIKGCRFVSKFLNSSPRCYLSQSVMQSDDSLQNMKRTMRSCRIYHYGGLDDIGISDTIARPLVERPDTVLVEIHGASLNTIDTWMLGGYGSTTFNTVRQQCYNQTSEFPLILGRDFSGIVRAVGQKAKHRFCVGDEVMGALWPFEQGSLSEFVSISCDSALVHKPANVSHLEAASLPYAALTAYTALGEVGFGIQCGGKRPSERLNGKRILIHGGTGGVGTVAIQLARIWGAEEVAATCLGSNSVEWLRELGAHRIVVSASDQSSDVSSALSDSGADEHHPQGYHLILDCVGHNESTLKPLLASNSSSSGPSSRYVTLRLPLLSNVDEYGPGPGTVVSLLQFSSRALARLFPRAESFEPSYHYRWSLFRASAANLSDIAHMVKRSSLRPCVDQVFELDNAVNAFRHVSQGPNRGKTVVKIR